MILKEMEWKDAKALIERRLENLMRCKNGSIATEMNERRKALGPRPAYTEAEKVEIRAGAAKAISKKVKMSVAMVKRLKCEPSLIAQHIKESIQDTVKNLYKHPKESAWSRDLELLQEEQGAREAQLEADFRECADKFLMGILPITDFPRVYDEMEQREW